MIKSNAMTQLFNFQMLIKSVLISPALFAIFILSISSINAINESVFSNPQIRLLFIIFQLYVYYYFSHFLAFKIDSTLFKKKLLYDQFLIDLADHSIQFKSLESIFSYLNQKIPLFLPVEKCTFTTSTDNTFKNKADIFTHTLILKNNTITLFFHLSHYPLSPKNISRLNRIVNILHTPIQNILLFTELQNNIDQLQVYQNQIIENERKKSTLQLNKGSINRLSDWLSHTLETAIIDIQKQLHILKNDLSKISDTQFVNTLETRCARLSSMTQQFIQDETELLDHFK